MPPTPLEAPDPSKHLTNPRFNHFADRLWERYRVELTDEKYRDMLAQIEDPNCPTFLKRVHSPSQPRELHRVTVGVRSPEVIYTPYSGKSVRVKPYRGFIITAVLPHFC